MGKKQLFAIGVTFLFILALAGCGDKENLQSDKSNKIIRTGAAVSAIAERGSVYVKKKEESKWEGLYTARQQAEEDSVSAETIYIHRVTDKEIWLSYEGELDKLDYLHGIKKGENRYEFCREEENPEDGVSSLKGEIAFKDDHVFFNINRDVGKEEELLDREVEYSLRKADSNDTVLELTHCLDRSYQEIHQEVFRRNLTCVDMGKERGTDKVSYIEICPETYNNPWEETRYYQMKGIGICSTKEECKKVMGMPTEESANNLIYRSEDGYEICFTFQDDHVSKMGIYLGTREEALKEYTVGDFTMRGCKIIKWNKPFQKGGTIELPEDTAVIGTNAISQVEVENEDDGEEDLDGAVESAEKETKWNYTKDEVELHVPKDVYLEPGVFGCIPSPFKVTFEEGRREIEPGLLLNLAGKMTIRLPKSVKIIRKEALYDRWCNGVKIILQDGIEEIQERGLQNYKGSLPSSLKKIGYKGLYQWEPVSKNDFTLPKGLEEIGDYGIYVDFRGQSFLLPKTLKKLGYGSLGTYTASNNFEMEEGNQNFSTDKYGNLYSKDYTVLYEFKDFYKDSIPKRECKIIMTPYHSEYDEQREMLWKYPDDDETEC